MFNYSLIIYTYFCNQVKAFKEKYMSLFLPEYPCSYVFDSFQVSQFFVKSYPLLPF